MKEQLSGCVSKAQVAEREDGLTLLRGVSLQEGFLSGTHDFSSRELGREGA